MVFWFAMPLVTFAFEGFVIWDSLEFFGWRDTREAVSGGFGASTTAGWIAMDNSGVVTVVVGGVEG